jgi:hypothetical protein
VAGYLVQFDVIWIGRLVVCDGAVLHPIHSQPKESKKNVGGIVVKGETHFLEISHDISPVPE